MDAQKARQAVEDIRNLKRAGKAVAKQAAEAERLDAEQYAELMNAIGL